MTENINTNEQVNEQANELITIDCKDLSSSFATLEVGQGAKVRESTTSDNVVLFNAVNGSAEKVEDYLGLEVDIVDIVVTSADVLKDINDPDPEHGEKENKPVMHFFTADGKHISSISNGIRRATENLLACSFIPTPEHPFKIRFKEVKTKKGTAHSFDLVSM